MASPSEIDYNELGGYSKLTNTPSFHPPINTIHPSIMTVTPRNKLDPDDLMKAKSEESDVIFVAVNKKGEQVTYPAHRKIMADASEVFDAMFFGPLLGDWKYKKVLVVKVDDAEAEVYKEMLRYVYSKRAHLSEDNALHLLYLSNKYMMSDLRDLCQEYLEANLDPDNFCVVFDGVLLLEDQQFEERLLLYYRLNAQSVLSCLTFLEISREALQKLLALDVVNVKELDLFKACHRWASDRLSKIQTEECLEKEILQMFGDTNLQLRSSNQSALREILGEKALRNIRFPSMSKKDFLSAMDVSCILTRQEIKDIKYAIDSRIIKDSLEFSMQPRREFNEVCATKTDKSDAKLIESEFNETIFVPVNTVFISALQIAPKRNSKKVLVELSRVRSNIELLASTTGDLNDERLKFKRPIKIMKDKVYMILIRYEQTRNVDCVIKRPANQKRGPQIKDAFFLLSPKTSAISKMYYYVL